MRGMYRVYIDTEKKQGKKRVGNCQEKNHYSGWQVFSLLFLQSEYYIRFGQRVSENPSVHFFLSHTHTLADAV